ncbi:hypothetical protein HDK90DRAFT_461201 [Phyllosticta capitalensis]|uniref:Uncharacterized protein n=1 Tax=Phyllosticta capitalensis TaxID=121624 RepID=A0ABR1Z2U3_9PEZI
MDRRTGPGGGRGRGRGSNRQLEHLEFLDDEVSPTPWPQRLQPSRASRNYRVHPDSGRWNSRLPPRVVPSSNDRAQLSSTPVPGLTERGRLAMERQRLFGERPTAEMTASIRETLRRNARRNADPPSAEPASYERPASARRVQFDVPALPATQTEFYRRQFDKIFNAMAEPSPQTSLPIRYGSGSRVHVFDSVDDAPQRTEPSPPTSLQVGYGSESRVHVFDSVDDAPRRRRRNVDPFPFTFSSVPVGQSPPPSWLGTSSGQRDPQTPKSESSKASPMTKKSPGRKRKGDLSPIPEEIQNDDDDIIRISAGIPRRNARKIKVYESYESQPPRKKRKTGQASKTPEEQTFGGSLDHLFWRELATSDDPSALKYAREHIRAERLRKRARKREARQAWDKILKKEESEERPDDGSDNDLNMLPPAPTPTKKTRKRKAKGKGKSKKSKADDAPYIVISDDDEDEDDIKVLPSPKSKAKGKGKSKKSKADDAPYVVISDDDADSDLNMLPPTPASKKKTRQSNAKGQAKSKKSKPAKETIIIDLTDGDEEDDLNMLPPTPASTRKTRNSKAKAYKETVIIDLTDSDEDDDQVDTLHRSFPILKKNKNKEKEEKQKKEVWEPLPSGEGPKWERDEKTKQRFRLNPRWVQWIAAGRPPGYKYVPKYWATEKYQWTKRKIWELNLDGHNRPLNPAWAKREAAGESVPAYMPKYLDEEKVMTFKKKGDPRPSQLNPRWLQWEADGKPRGFRYIPKFLDEENLEALEDANSTVSLDSEHEKDDDFDENEASRDQLELPRFLRKSWEGWDAAELSESEDIELSSDDEEVLSSEDEDKKDSSSDDKDVPPEDGDDSSSDGKDEPPSSSEEEEEEEGKVWELRRYGPDRVINSRWRQWKDDGKPFKMVGPIPKYLDEEYMVEDVADKGQRRRINPRLLTWEAAGKPSGYKRIPEFLEDDEPAVRDEVTAYELKRFGGKRSAILCPDPNDPENKTTSESGDSSGDDDAYSLDGPSAGGKRKAAQMIDYYNDEVAAAQQFNASTPSASASAPPAMASPAKKRKVSATHAVASCPKPSTPQRGRPKKIPAPSTPKATKQATKGKTNPTPPQSKAKATTNPAPKAKAQGKAKVVVPKATKQKPAAKAKTPKPAAEKKAKVTKPTPPAPAGTRRSARLKDKK